MIKNSANHDCYLINQFIGVCGAFRQMDLATFAFCQMEFPNVFVYNAMIRGFVQCYQPVKAMEFYVLMLRESVFPSSFSFSSLIKACRIESALQFGESIHSQIWKNGFESHAFVQTALIDFYSNLNKIVECMKVFEELPERDVFAWTTMITSYVRVGDMSSAHRLFEGMPERNVATWNTMIDGYSKLGNVVSAAALFNQMPVKDLITWTTMINCYSQNKQFREAVDVFQEMNVSGFSPDEVTISTVISACAHLGALQLGREIHHYVLCNKLDVDVYIGSALVDLYAKCGSLEKALVVFFKLGEKNLFCWNAVIDGLAVHGHGAEALAMFNRMEREKVKPNWVTFISVLGACTHAGLVEEGRKSFSSMIQTYSISPGIEHYGCMIDLLSKAGLLDEALELTKTMTVEPNSVVWGAILGGCKLHKNLAIAKVALEKLMHLEPDNCGYYLLLINIYAEGNHWKEVAEVRKTMNDRGVQKQCPGSSWVELDGKVEEFVASDISHSMFGEICKLLHELDWKLKLENDVPEYKLFS
ncbi:Pentatricopeptide repeat-containing protein [Thalictrum thalictroides]|uniref:Pentatricopeptide repeat-containing protein n=1 Tax=Thalictrum thalictroides TaxID=46969 RepID=A0A7J6V5J3_THATH|nr:Pentatricopeptide repeat-containing protein [Thalictrum thalictroides]